MARCIMAAYGQVYSRPTPMMMGSFFQRLSNGSDALWVGVEENVVDGQHRALPLEDRCCTM